MFDADFSNGQGVTSIDSDRHKDYALFEDRDRHLIRYLRRKRFLKQGMRLLDIGAGTGHIDKAIRNVLDISLSAVEPCLPYHEELRSVGCEPYGSVDDLPEDSIFDACLMIEVIEHVVDPVAFVRAVGSRLHPGAGLFLTTPAGVVKGLNQALDTFSMPGHLQFFTPASLRKCLRKAGFKNVRYRYVLAMYPNSDLTDDAYQSSWAKRYAVHQYMRYVQGRAPHLTFFATKE